MQSLPLRFFWHLLCQCCTDIDFHPVWKLIPSSIHFQTGIKFPAQKSTISQVFHVVWQSLNWSMMIKEIGIVIPFHSKKNHKRHIRQRKLLSGSSLKFAHSTLLDEVWTYLKKILQNSGKLIRIAKGLLFDSLVSIKSENVAPLRKIPKPFLKRWICFISSIFLLHNSKHFLAQNQPKRKFYYAKLIPGTNFMK